MNTMNIVRAATLILIMAGILTLTFRVFEAQIDPPKVSITSQAYRGACYVDSLLLHGDGKTVAVFKGLESFVDGQDFRLPRGFAIFDFSSSVGGTTTRAEEIPTIFSGGPNSLIPLAWTDDELIFRTGRHFLSSAKIHEDWRLRQIEIPKSLQSSHIILDSGSTLDSVNNLFNSSEFSYPTLIDDLRSKLTVLSDDPVIFGVDVKNQQRLMRYSSVDGYVRMNPAKYYMYPDVYNAGGRIAFSSLGFSDANDAMSEARYLRPVVRHSTKQKIGDFSPNRVFAVPGADQINSLVRERQLEILDAAIEDNGRVILAMSSSGIHLLHWDALEPSTHSERSVCQFAPSNRASTPGQPETEKSLPPGEYGITLTDNAATTAVLYAGAKSRSDSIVLYFHGGPGGTNYGRQELPELRELRRLGFDVLAVEYSGSVGGGLRLSKGLSEKPGFGFDEDAIAIYRWITDRGYKSANIYARSFGAAPAMVFQRKHPEFIDRSVYLAPLLELPAPDTTEQSAGRFFRIESGAQLQFELGVFGGADRRREFSSWLVTLAADFDASANDLFVFGELDERTPVSSAPRSIIEGARVIEVPRTTHEFLGSSDMTRKLVFDHLAGG